MTIGEILFALADVAKSMGVEIEDYVGTALIEDTKNLIPLFKERLYFRGMGGELMKQACSDFIQKCSLARLPFHKDDITGFIIFPSSRRIHFIRPNFCRSLVKFA